MQTGGNPRQTLTVAEVNTMLLKLGSAPGSAGQLDVRVKSEITGSPVQPVLSGTSTLTGTPYVVTVQYSSLFVPGTYLPRLGTRQSTGTVVGEAVAGKYLVTLLSVRGNYTYALTKL